MEKVYDGSPMIEVNGRRYALPRAPVVVVCVDGCEPDYLDRAVEGGAMPWLGSAGGRRGHDERPEISARRDHPGAAGGRRRRGGGGDGQGQAAAVARSRDDPGHLLLVGE